MGEEKDIYIYAYIDLYKLRGVHIYVLVAK